MILVPNRWRALIGPWIILVLMYTALNQTVAKAPSTYFVFGDNSGGSTYLVVQMIQIRMDRCYSRLILQGCLRSTPYAVFSPTQWRLPRLAVDITEYT